MSNTCMWKTVNDLLRPNNVFIRLIQLIKKFYVSSNRIWVDDFPYYCQRCSHQISNEERKKSAVDSSDRLWNVAREWINNMVIPSVAMMWWEKTRREHSLENRMCHRTNVGGNHMSKSSRNCLIFLQNMFPLNAQKHTCTAKIER